MLLSNLFQNTEELKQPQPAAATSITPYKPQQLEELSTKMLEMIQQRKQMPNLTTTKTPVPPPDDNHNNNRPAVIEDDDDSSATATAQHGDTPSRVHNPPNDEDPTTDKEIQPPSQRVHVQEPIAHPHTALPNTNTPQTYRNQTGHNAKRARRARRKKRNTAPRQQHRDPPPKSTTRSGRVLKANKMKDHVYTVTIDSPAELYALLGYAINPDTGKAAGYKELLCSSHGHLWSRSASKEFRHLFDGNKTIPSGTKTMTFIHKDEIPANKRCTYLQIVCAYRPEKEDPNRIRVTAGGNLVEYHSSLTTKTAELTTVKTHWNSVISTPHARY
ncbi:MAG: hypothetical protein AAGJ35_10145, partial [Myxococcota bacterium]